MCKESGSERPLFSGYWAVQRLIRHNVWNSPRRACKRDVALFISCTVNLQCTSFQLPNPKLSRWNLLSNPEIFSPVFITSAASAIQSLEKYGLPTDMRISKTPHERLPGAGGRRSKAVALRLPPPQLWTAFEIIGGGDRSKILISLRRTSNLNSLVQNNYPSNVFVISLFIFEFGIDFQNSDLGSSNFHRDLVRLQFLIVLLRPQLF